VAKAVGCVSGGLDSMLAVRLIQRQGIDVIAVHAVHLWHPHTPAPGEKPEAVRRAEALGAEVRTIDAAEADLAMVRRPKFGLGKHMNPCIDCRIWTLLQAKAVMEAENAAFVFTGEVLGQRPMSQRRHVLGLVEKESGLEDRLVRPLSAKCLAPSKPERDGLLDRDRLCGFAGRSRKPQMALAAELGITEYPTPAGGCLLTDPGFAHRLRERMRTADVTPADVELLKVGRHFRLDGGAWIVVGRHERDNVRLAALLQPGDIRLEAADIPGPTTLVRGPADANVVAQAAAITLRYTKATPGEPRDVTVQPVGGLPWTLRAAPADEAFCRKHLITLEEKK